jgi:hypothetical protein
VGGFSLRTWQREALGLWKAAGNKGIVEVVTGGGKTIFALSCIRPCGKKLQGTYSSAQKGLRIRQQYTVSTKPMIWLSCIRTWSTFRLPASIFNLGLANQSLLTVFHMLAFCPPAETSHWETFRR